MAVLLRHNIRDVLVPNAALVDIDPAAGFAIAIIFPRTPPIPGQVFKVRFQLQVQTQPGQIPEIGGQPDHILDSNGPIFEQGIGMGMPDIVPAVPATEDVPDFHNQTVFRPFLNLEGFEAACQVGNTEGLPQPGGPVRIAKTPAELQPVVIGRSSPEVQNGTVYQQIGAPELHQFTLSHVKSKLGLTQPERYQRSPFE